MKAKNKLGISWVTIFRDQEKDDRSKHGIYKRYNWTKVLLQKWVIKCT